MNTEKSIKSQIIAHLDGELSASELKELFTWVNKSKENARYYTEIKDLWDASLLNASEFADTKNEWEQFKKQVSSVNTRKAPNLRILLKSSWKIAAVLLLGIIIGKTFFILPDSKEPIYFTSVAPEGSISQLILPDSTIIFLNAGSEIKYNTDSKSKKREVFLKGEAWFDVVNIQNQPFIVHTPYYNVNVVGTQFNVKAYESDNKVEATLEKGSIIISESEKFEMDKDIQLVPGEQITYNKRDHSLQKRKVNTEIVTSWKDNKLTFINMSLQELFILIERRYGVDIEVEDTRIYDLHYSGTLKNESIIELMDIIRHTQPIQYEIENQKIKIFKK